VTVVLDDLLRPWRTTATWRRLVHVVLDLPLGVALSDPLIVMSALSVGLVFVFPISLAICWLLFTFTRVAARVERSRAEALLDIRIAAPASLTATTAWARFKERFRSKVHWCEYVYVLLRLPLGGALAGSVLLSWCGSVILLTLPLYAGACRGTLPTSASSRSAPELQQPQRVHADCWVSWWWRRGSPSALQPSTVGTHGRCWGRASVSVCRHASTLRWTVPMPNADASNETSTMVRSSGSSLWR
jgi:hypothetical protein